MREKKGKLENIPSRWRFGKLPADILFNSHLDSHEKLIMGCLLFHGEGEVFPGINRLALLASCSTKKVTRAIKSLEKKIGLKVTRLKGGVNRYDMQACEAHFRGGVGTVSPGGRDCESGGVGTVSPSNETSLNETQERDYTVVGNGNGNGNRFTPQNHPKEHPGIRRLVGDWYDTFEGVREFKSSEPGGLVHDTLKRFVYLRGAEKGLDYGVMIVGQEITEYWMWYKRNKWKGIEGGDIRNFIVKENMLCGIVMKRMGVKT